MNTTDFEQVIVLLILGVALAILSYLITEPRQRPEEGRLNKYQFYHGVIAFVVLGAEIWVNFFLPINIGVTYIPTLINGITASLSVIVGFSGVVIGFMFREANDRDRTYFIVLMVILVLPLTMLWTTYAFLTMNILGFAVRWALSALIVVLYVFFVVIIHTVRVMESQARANVSPRNPTLAN
ncbi:MAG TPA: hypothetical protein VK487_06365 [Candidatus Bathyarchaeia archaeon]|nr:hypothetical protein [Candidatus Bathyarchaeia archaeon]